MNVISKKTHTVIGLIIGAALLIAPWLFGFADVDSSRTVAIIVGVFVLLNELITTSPLSPMKLVPMRTHIALDVITGLFLAASPWLLGFADTETEAWVPHLLVGLVIMGYALMTDPDEEGVRTTDRV